MEKLTQTEFVEGFVKSVKALKEGKEVTFYWWLKQNGINEKDWAIVLGWSGDWDDENDSCCKGHYRIMAKVAYQPHNCIMQGDYDADWTMPHDEETGEVDDCDIAIYESDTDDNLRQFAKDLMEWSKKYI